MDYNRRKFIKGMVIVSAGVPFSGALASVSETLKESGYPINFFTKPLDKYGPGFMMDTLKMAGDGLDLTVRPKGCVLPEKVETDLPKMVNMANKKGLGLKMMITRIKNPDDPFAYKVLAMPCGYKN